MNDRMTTRGRRTLARLALLRHLVTSLVVQIPVAGQFFWLVDVLFIFGRSRRCVHDHIADTVVVRTPRGGS